MIVSYAYIHVNTVKPFALIYQLDPEDAENINNSFFNVLHSRDATEREHNEIATNIDADEKVIQFSSLAELLEYEQQYYVTIPEYVIENLRTYE